MKRHLLGMFMMSILPMLFAAADEPALDFTSPERAVLSLNGTWDVLPLQGMALPNPLPAAGWQKEQVPSPRGQTKYIKTAGGPYSPNPNTLLDKSGKEYKEKTMLAACYKRSFELPAAYLKSGRRVMLYFYGAAFKPEVMLNGQKAGGTVQAALPFEFDVTDLLKSGKNELLVVLYSREALLDIANKCYIAPSNGVMAGIRGGVELRFVSPVNISDVFVKTSVKNKKIDVELEISNLSGKTETVTPRVDIRNADNQLQIRLEGQAVQLEPGKTKTVELSGNWIAPRLWSPENPAIYYAAASLYRDQKEIDLTTVRFGFKEFEIRGRDFFLNGIRTTLLRNSTLGMVGDDKCAVREKNDTVFNCYRLHIGFNNELLLNSADERGLMTIPEAAWSWSEWFPAAKKDVWLGNTLDYFNGWIRLHRNRPSVIMWSLCNETYWDNRFPADMVVARQILELAKKLDPVHPQQGDGECSWNGILPTINVHYPEGDAGTIKLEYTNSGTVVPNDLQWLTKTGENSSWRAKFKWDRPLMFGEYWLGGALEDLASYMGDSAYDWEQWRWQDLRGQDGQPNPFQETLQRATDYYRTQGVACLNPWSGYRPDTLKADMVRPVDFHPNFFSGKTGIRKVVIFNGSRTGYNYLNMMCRLEVDKTTVWQKKIDSGVEPGQSRTFDIPVECPEVSSVTPAKLTVRVMFWEAGGYHELSRLTETVYIVPKPDFAGLDKQQLLLLDPSGKTAAALQSAGLDIAPQKQLSAELLQNKKLVIIGENTNASAYAKILETYARSGGRVLVLPQDAWQPLFAELPECDPKHAASQSWFRSNNSPMLEGLYSEQFNYWRPDNIISQKTYWKPSAGRFEILLESGGRYGICWSPLTAVKTGKGEFILCQLQVTSKLKDEPMAGYMLGRIIRYGLEAAASIPVPLNVLAGNNQPLKDALAATGVVVNNGIGAAGPVLVDASQELSAAQIDELKQALNSGRKLWLHGFTPQTAGKIAPLMPFTPELTAPDKTVSAAAVRSHDPLIDSLSCFDFFWTRIDMEAREDYFQNSKQTAKLGEWALKLPRIGSGTKLLEPAFLTKVPSGKGVILFDTLQWEKAFGSESDKAARILSALVTNLGADIQLKPETQYQYFHVDMKPYVNMGYYDEKEGDQKGGWTDQGENDMRFFLTNHTGKGGGRADGMPVATEEFPAVAKLGKRPYGLIDPKKNNGKGVISFAGSDKCPFFPKEVKGIQVNHKANMLWFLQTACWAGVPVNTLVAQYQINYADGTNVIIPVRVGMEIGDWWNPSPLSNAEVAWTGKNLMQAPIGIWGMSWVNPKPDKEISSIDVTAALSPVQLVLLAITGGVESDGSSSGKCVSLWEMKDFKDGKLKNKIAGGSVLSANPPLPQLVSEPMPGLRFTKNSLSFGRCPDVMSSGAPYSMIAEIMPEGVPGAYCGGIVQAFSYLNSGFRISIGQDMKLGVEINTGKAGSENVKGIQSKNVLQTGRKYKVEVRFDGRQAYLYINDRLDTSVSCPMPAPYRGDVQIGCASGKDYYFIGIIGSVGFYALEPVKDEKK